VQWTPDARRLLTGNDKGQFTLWNGASFNYESITQVHDDSIRGFAYSHNGQSLVSVDKLGMIKYFTPHLTNIHGFQGHREACHGAAWSPNDEKFVTGGDDGLVKIWSYREAKEENVLSGGSHSLHDCNANADPKVTDGMFVASIGIRRKAWWFPGVKTCWSNSGIPARARISAHCKLVMTVKRASLTLLRHSHKAVVNTCKWNPQGHLVATAGGDGLIRMFDIRTFRELDPMKGHGNGKEINCQYCVTCACAQSADK
jgi:polyadenylation factor subunit 2